ncbi:MAG: Polysaccharide deacetylase [Bryobacterales bacterium]|jgi:peptidoglycan/xylan/chitin deacetylase (PgdA/CDA1 family)|nr:Polysaccharide deacetylase [Bryobacterales bacterium]
MSMKETAAYLVSRGARHIGLSRALRMLGRRRLVVLNYHGVVPDEYARTPLIHPNVIGVTEFSRQMADVARLFHPINVSDLQNWESGKPNALLVTFDDGYRNVLTHAVPVLERFGIPALMTICPGYVGQSRMLWPDEIHWRLLWWPEKIIPLPEGAQQWPCPCEFSPKLALANSLREACKRIPHEHAMEYLEKLRKHPVKEANPEVSGFLSWDDVLTLQARGFEIGSHTMEHPILARVTPEYLAAELRESKLSIEQRTGRECSSFAYPNGGRADISRAAVNEVKGAGYRFAFTVMGQPVSVGDDPLLLDRIYIPALSSPSEFEGRISGLHSAIKRCRV